jgi:hypothetical protein
VFRGKAQPKADVTIILSDDTLVDLASGKVYYIHSHFLPLSNPNSNPHFQLNGQKAFMTGKLKTRGNVMLATKLDGVLKVRSSVFYHPLTSFRFLGCQGKAVEFKISEPVRSPVSFKSRTMNGVQIT